MKNEKADLIAEIQELKLRVARLELSQSKQRPIEVSSVADLKEGDRVRIRNKIRKPSHWPSTTQWSVEKERLATVEKVTSERVHLLTDNGNRTWRAHANVRKL
jgi:hypothetical protein